MRLRTIIAFGAGYVLGARAGRERYEQIRRWFDRASDTAAARQMKDRGRDLMGSGLDVAKGLAADGLSAASDQLRKMAD